MQRNRLFTEIDGKAWDEGSNPHCDARTGWGGVFFFLSPQQPGKPIVDGVTGLDGDNVSFDGLAYKGDVADDVQQFVSGWFVVPYKWFVLYVTQFRCIVPLGLGQLAE